MLGRLLGHLVVVTLVTGAPYGDLVRKLPGLEENPPFKHYSGYLSVPPDKQFHYWLTESQRSPRHDPLVLWLNGGPGCSSMTGLLEELGPFRIDPDGKRVITNYEYGWNKIANILFIESPAGVGYSYSKSGNYTIDDQQTCDDNYAALKDFFSRFPEFQSHDLYLTGESYAGVYIPMLAARVADDKSLNLQGFAVGNGVLDEDINLSSLVYYTFYHGLIGNVMWNKLKTTCCPGESAYNCNFAIKSRQSEACQILVESAYNTAWAIGLNPYNLFATCDGGVPDRTGYMKQISSPTKAVFAIPGFYNSAAVQKSILQKLRESEVEVDSGTPCTNSSHVEAFLNSPEVRRAIHVSPSVKRWASCSAEVSALYKKTVFNLKDQFLKVLRKGHRVLVYNGDADMACNFLGNEWFVENLGIKQLSRHDAWYYNDQKYGRQIGGFFRRYSGLDFVTIKGSGHFVPKDKPRQAYNIFKSYIKNRSL